VNRGTLSDPSFTDSLKKTSNEKEATPKNAKGLFQKTFDEKRGNPKKHKWAHSKDLQ
jgi:hypothetical protein